MHYMNKCSHKDINTKVCVCVCRHIVSEAGGCVLSLLKKKKKKNVIDSVLSSTSTVCLFVCVTELYEQGGHCRASLW